MTSSTSLKISRGLAPQSGNQHIEDEAQAQTQPKPVRQFFLTLCFSCTTPPQGIGRGPLRTGMPLEPALTQRLPPPMKPLFEDNNPPRAVTIFLRAELGASSATCKVPLPSASIISNRLARSGGSSLRAPLLLQQKISTGRRSRTG